MFILWNSGQVLDLKADEMAEFWCRDKNDARLEVGARLNWRRKSELGHIRGQRSNRSVNVDVPATGTRRPTVRRSSSRSTSAWTVVDDRSTITPCSSQLARS